MCAFLLFSWTVHFFLFIAGTFFCVIHENTRKKLQKTASCFFFGFSLIFKRTKSDDQQISTYSVRCVCIRWINEIWNWFFHIRDIRDKQHCILHKKKFNSRIERNKPFKQNSVRIFLWTFLWTRNLYGHFYLTFLLLILHFAFEIYL